MLGMANMARERTWKERRWCRTPFAATNQRAKSEAGTHKQRKEKKIKATRREDNVVVNDSRVQQAVRVCMLYARIYTYVCMCECLCARLL